MRESVAPDPTFSYLMVEEYLERRRRHFSTVDLPVSLHSDAGLRLWVPARPSRRAETWVLIHGAGNDAGFGFWFLIEEALLSGIRVATWHLPGHGYGTRSGLSPRTARSRLAAVLRAIRVAGDLMRSGRLFLVGQSLGGALALDQALPVHAGDRSMVETEHLAGVISVSPAVRIPELLPIHREFPWFLRRPVFETAFWIGPRRMLPAFGSFRRERFPVAFETLKHMPGGEPGVAETALEDLGTGFIRVVRELELGERAALPLSREASRRFPPVLVLQGVRDGIIPVEFVRQFEASLEHVRRGRFEFQYLPFNTHFDILVDRMVIRRMIAWTHAVSRLPLAQVA